MDLESDSATVRTIETGSHFVPRERECESVLDKPGQRKGGQINRERTRRKNPRTADRRPQTANYTILYCTVLKSKGAEASLASINSPYLRLGLLHRGDSTRRSNHRATRISSRRRSHLGRSAAHLSSPSHSLSSSLHPPATTFVILIQNCCAELNWRTNLPSSALVFPLVSPSLDRRGDPTSQSIHSHCVLCPVLRCS